MRGYGGKYLFPDDPLIGGSDGTRTPSRNLHTSRITVLWAGDDPSQIALVDACAFWLPGRLFRDDAKATFNWVAETIAHASPTSIHSKQAHSIARLQVGGSCLNVFSLPGTVFRLRFVFHLRSCARLFVQPHAAPLVPMHGLSVACQFCCLLNFLPPVSLSPMGISILIALPALPETTRRTEHYHPCMHACQKPCAVVKLTAWARHCQQPQAHAPRLFSCVQSIACPP